jgi:hypothetical protein
MLKIVQKKKHGAVQRASQLSLLDFKPTSLTQNHIRFQGYVTVFPVVVHNFMQRPLIHRLID